MFKQKFMCVTIIALMFFVIVSGGCGGGSDSPIGNSGTTSQDITPTPDNPEETPNTPENPNNPETEYDISTLTGTWAASNFNGTASGSGMSAVLRINEGYSNTISFSNVQVNGDNMSLSTESQIYLDAYNSTTGAAVYTDLLDDFGSGHTTLEFQKVSVNKWRMSRTRSEGTPEITTVTLTSATTANVERDGYFIDNDNPSLVFHYQYSYTITKQ